MKTQKTMTTMTIREIKALLDTTDKYAVIGPLKMTNKESRNFLFNKELQGIKMNVIDKGTYLVIWME